MLMSDPDTDWVTMYAVGRMLIIGCDTKTRCCCALIAYASK